MTVEHREDTDRPEVTPRASESSDHALVHGLFAVTGRCERPSAVAAACAQARASVEAEALDARIGAFWRSRQGAGMWSSFSVAALALLHTKVEEIAAWIATRYLPIEVQPGVWIWCVLPPVIEVLGHEAAHAVVGVAYGFPPFQYEIVPDGVSLGHLWIYPPVGEPTPDCLPAEREEWCDYGRLLLAGRVGQARLRVEARGTPATVEEVGAEFWQVPEAQNEVEETWDIAGKLARGRKEQRKLFDDLLLDVVKLLTEDKGAWNAVLFLAAVLRDHPLLGGDDGSWVIERARGGHSYEAIRYGLAERIADRARLDTICREVTRIMEGICRAPATAWAAR